MTGIVFTESLERTGRTWSTAPHHAGAIGAAPTSRGARTTDTSSTSLGALAAAAGIRRIPRASLHAPAPVRHVNASAEPVVDAVRAEGAGADDPGAGSHVSPVPA